jgi:hypothetical protein
MKQGRAFGVVVATQNPMDLDYRALSKLGAPRLVPIGVGPLDAGE